MLTVFYLENCPYCRMAKKAVQELQAEIANPKEIQWIEESRQPDVADAYDYYHVPAIFSGHEKLYECSPADNYDTIKRHFRQAMA